MTDRQEAHPGGRTVYGTARDPRTVDLPGAEVLQLDITDPAPVAAARDVASDVDLLVNNAGIATMQNLLTGDLERIRAKMDTHSWGTLAMTRAFSPTRPA